MRFFLNFLPYILNVPSQVEEPGGRRPKLAAMRARIMTLFLEMAPANYPDQRFKNGSIVNGVLASGWCDIPHTTGFQ